MSHAIWEIIETTDDCVLIRDVGHWDFNRTVTNDAEYVVEELLFALGGGLSAGQPLRRLEYIDSDGQRDQLLVKDERFAGYAPAGGEL